MEYLETLRPYYLILYYIFVSLVVLSIILDNKKPEKSFSYILLILLFPIGGLVIYFLFGAQYQKKKLLTKKRYFDRVFLNELKSQEKKPFQDDLSETYPKLPTLFYNIEQVNFTRRNRLELLRNGEEKFPKLLEAIRKAEQSIHLEYYIIAESEIQKRIFDLLEQKAAEGLKVRVIYDDVGSNLTKKSIRRLELAGVQIRPYMPVWFSGLAHKANYRNHRKIAVIDDRIGFLGGVNINDKYINPNALGLYWRDSHLYLEGEAVQELQYLFVSDWYLVSSEKIDLAQISLEEQMSPMADLPVSVLGSDYGKNNQTIMEAFFGMITSAREEVLITTPYFIPNDTILNALKISAKSGVKVKIMLPEKPDIKIAYYASQTYLKDLIESGVEVYYYAKGMMHSKTMIVDGKISTIGSTNMDQRSFSLNAEVNAFVLDQKLAQDLRIDFLKDQEDAYLLSIERLKNRSFGKKILCSMARLVAPIL